MPGGELAGCLGVDAEEDAGSKDLGDYMGGDHVVEEDALWMEVLGSRTPRPEGELACGQYGEASAPLTSVWRPG